MNPLQLLDQWLDTSYQHLGDERPILNWGNGRTWSLKNSFEGTLIVGNTGSGKTSGPGQIIARSFLRNDYSGLVLCVKDDETKNWQNLCKLEGRERDLVVFRPEAGLCFNPLEFEPILENRVQLFLKLIDYGSPGAVAGAAVSFWTLECQRLLRNLFQLADSAGLPPVMEAWENILKKAPSSLADLTTAAWLKDSPCAHAMKAASGKALLDRNTRLALDYFEVTFPTLNPKTRSIIVTMVGTTFDTLGRSPLFELFTGRSTISPRAIFDQGKILIVDLPVKVDKQVGRYANVIWKYCFQQEVERRREKTPTFIWADEAQLFLTQEDYLFQTTARSSKCASVYLTQNYPNLLATLGKHPTDSLVGNLLTRLFHRNDCPITNDWASQLMGERMVEVVPPSGVMTPPSHRPAPYYEMVRIVPPHKFASLKCGGKKNGYIVEGYGMAPEQLPSSRIIRFHQIKPGRKGSCKPLP